MNVCVQAGLVQWGDAIPLRRATHSSHFSIVVQRTGPPACAPFRPGRFRVRRPAHPPGYRAQGGICADKGSGFGRRQVFPGVSLTQDG